MILLEKGSTLRRQISAIASIVLIAASVFTFGATGLMVAPTAEAAPACEDIRIARVSASGHEAANPPANAIDNNLKTRWSSLGFGSWITADLGKQMAICSVNIAWYKGDTRVNEFTISVSSDGKSYTKVYTGESSGKTANPEKYTLKGTVTARYVRITVSDINKGSNGEWVSITEIDVYGYTPSSTQAAVADTTAPTVKITSPSDGSTVTASASGTITIRGTATDNKAVKIVEVRVDDGAYVAATPKAAGDWSSWSVVMQTKAGKHRITSRATDSAGNQAWNSINVTVNILSSSGGGGTSTLSSTTTTVDKFGVKKIFPTAKGGNEWYVNMENPANDPMFRNLETMKKQPDGSWQLNGGSNGQVRLEAWSPVNQKWVNVEITMYAKIVSGSNELLQLYSRGGHHTSKDVCLGSAYKARLYGNGEAKWVKEVNHPAYTSNKGTVDVTDKPLKGRWVGFKAVIYNFVENGKTYVRMESYIDDDVTDSKGNLVIKNNWKRASVVEDRGGWSTNDSDFNPSCAPLNKDSTKKYRQRDEILNMPGGTSTQNIAAFRTDDITWNFKYLSVREIQPPKIA
jgi:hypothetical protein